MQPELSSHNGLRYRLRHNQQIFHTYSMIHRLVLIMLASQVWSWPFDYSNEDIIVKINRKTHYPSHQKTIAIINPSFDGEDKPTIPHSVELAKSKLSVEENLSQLHDWIPIWIKETHPYLVFKSQARDKTSKSNNEPERSLKVKEAQSNRELLQTVESTLMGKQFEIIPKQKEVSSKPSLDWKNDPVEKLIYNETNLPISTNGFIELDPTTEQQSTDDATTPTTVEYQLPPASTEKTIFTVDTLESNSSPHLSKEEKLTTAEIAPNEHSSENDRLEIVTNETNTALDMPETMDSLLPQTDRSNYSESTPSFQVSAISIEASQSTISGKKSSKMHVTAMDYDFTSRKIRRKKTGSLKNPTTTKNLLQESITTKQIDESLKEKMNRMEKKENIVIDMPREDSDETQQKWKITTENPGNNDQNTANPDALETSNPETFDNDTTALLTKNRTNHAENFVTHSVEKPTVSADILSEKVDTNSVSELEKTDTTEAMDTETTTNNDLPNNLTESFRAETISEKSTMDKQISHKNTSEQLLNLVATATERMATNRETFSPTSDNTSEKIDTISRQETTVPIDFTRYTNTPVTYPVITSKNVTERLTLQNSSMNPETSADVTTVSSINNRTNQVESFITFFTRDAEEITTISTPNDQLHENSNSTLQTTLTDFLQSSTVKSPLQTANQLNIDIPRSLEKTNADVLNETYANETKTVEGKHPMYETESISTILPYTSQNIIKLITPAVARSGLSTPLNQIESSLGTKQTTSVNSVTKSPEGSKTVQAETSPAKEAAIEEMVNATESFNSLTTPPAAIINTSQQIIQNETLTTTASTSHATEKVISETTNVSTNNSLTPNKNKTTSEWISSTTPLTILESKTEESVEYEYEYEEYEER